MFVKFESVRFQFEEGKGGLDDKEVPMSSITYWGNGWSYGCHQNFVRVFKKLEGGWFSIEGRRELGSLRKK